MATGGYDKIVRLFDVATGTILKTFTGESPSFLVKDDTDMCAVSGHSLSISSVRFNPLGNLIVSGFVPPPFPLPCH